MQPDTVLTAVADASGTITNTSFTPPPDDLGVTFFVTATGSQSGVQATANFKAKKKTWTGAVSTDWNTAGNWNPSGVPTSSEDANIPAGLSRYPVISSNVSVLSVTLQSGNGAQPTLTVSGGTFSVSGILELNGGARVIQSGGVIDVIDFDSKAASSTFTQSGGTFRLHHNFANSGGVRLDGRHD